MKFLLTILLSWFSLQSFAAINGGSPIGSPNIVPPVQDVLVVVTDSRWDVGGTPGVDSWLQLLQRDPSWYGKYGLLDIAVSGESYASSVARIGTVYSQIATNKLATQKRTVLIMFYYNDAGLPLDTTKTNALIFWNFWKTNGWRVIVGTDPGPVGAPNLVNFNTWVTTTAAGAYDVCWNLATNVPLTYADGIHNDSAFNAILETNFTTIILPQAVSGLRPILGTPASVYGPFDIYGNPNAPTPGVGMNVHGAIRMFDHAEVEWVATTAGFTNNPHIKIRTDSADTLQFLTFNAVRQAIDQQGFMGFNTNQNYGVYPVFMFSKPNFDAFSQQIMGWVDQPGGATKAAMGTNGILMQFKGANVASASSIIPSGYITHVTGVTTINTITVPYSWFTGSIILIPDGLWSTGVAGNIQIATTAVVSKALMMTYDGAKWYPSY